MWASKQVVAAVESAVFQMVPNKNECEKFPYLISENADLVLSSCFQLY